MSRDQEPDGTEYYIEPYTDEELRNTFYFLDPPTTRPDPAAHLIKSWPAWKTLMFVGVPMVTHGVYKHSSWVFAALAFLASLIVATIAKVWYEDNIYKARRHEFVRTWDLVKWPLLMWGIFRFDRVVIFITAFCMATYWWLTK